MKIFKNLELDEQSGNKADRLVEPQAENKTFFERSRELIASKLRGLQSKFHFAFVAAALPILGSCSPNISEAGKDQTTDNVTVVDNSDQTPEQNDAENNNEVNLYSDGYGWYFNGSYPSDFELKVFADGKLVSDKIVNVDKGSFKVGEDLGHQIKEVDIQAFELNSDVSEGLQIQIDPNPPANGMIGISYAVPGASQ